MTEELKLSDVDVDGAIQESAANVMETLDREGDTRADFLRKAGVAGGAVMGGGALLGTLGTGTALAAGKGNGRPPKAFGKGDVGILNFALTLEYLERDFYIEASHKLPPLSEIGDTFLSTVLRDERAHVKLLKRALGKKMIKKPKFDFGGTTSDVQTFYETSFALENTGVGAYAGQAGNIKKFEYVKTALGIHSIEARHSGLVGYILTQSKQGVAPNGPVDPPLKASQVLRRVKKTGFIQG